MFAFDQFELDEQRQELWRGGEVVALNRRPYQLLLYLLRHHDRVVPKEELLSAVWRNVAVSDSALATALKEVRQALRDDGRRQRIIRTARGRGFRLVAPVRELARRLPAAPRSADSATPTGNGGGAPFVGRRDALARLCAALEATRRGSGGLFLVSGDAGVGKSRLAEVAAAHAEWLGFRALRASPAAWDRTPPPFSLWRGVFARLARSANAAGGQALLAPGAPDAALPAETGEGWPSTELDPDRARLRLIDGGVRSIVTAARREPLLLVLEDLHRVDPSSLQLLDHLVRDRDDAPLLVIATHRRIELEAAPPLAALVASASVRDGAAQIELSGLDLEEVQRFVAGRLGARAPEGLAAALAERSQGNPLFLSELVDFIEADGLPQGFQLRGELLRTEVPPHLQEIIRSRLAKCSRECVALLEIVAVVGRAADRDLIERLWPFVLRNLEPAFGEAQACGMLRDGERPGRCEFVHPLVQECIYAGLGEGERRDLHRRVADVLEELHERGAEQDAAELAHHFRNAGSFAHADRSIAFAITAARQAMESFGYAEAVTQLTRALECVEKSQGEARARLAELLLLLAEAQTHAGRPRDGMATYRRATEVARDLGRPTNFARAVLGMEQARRRAGDRSAETVSLLAEALTAVGSEHGALRAQLLAGLPGAIRSSTSKHLYGQLHALADEGLATARRAGDPETLAAALLCRADGLVHEGAAAERLGIADELVRIVERAGLRAFESSAHRLRMMAHLELGNAEAAEHEWMQTLRRGEGDPDPWVAAERLHVSILRSLLLGRFDDAEREIADCLEIGRETGSASILASAFGQLFALRREQGRLGELREAVEGRARALRSDHSWRSALWVLYWETGRRAEAAAEFRSFNSDELPYYARANFHMIMSVAAVLCAALRDRIRSAAYYALLRPHAGVNCVYPTVYAGSCSRYLGLLAGALGRFDAAERHFEAAQAMHRRMQARPFEAWTQLDLAETLVATGSPGERARAFALAEGALERATSLGMAAAAARAHQLLERASPGAG